jgi:hypothetical protein
MPALFSHGASGRTPKNEEGVKVQQYEVLHNAENAKLMKKYDQNRCGGVPFFYNTRTEKWLCGGG